MKARLFEAQSKPDRRTPKNSRPFGTALEVQAKSEDAAGGGIQEQQVTGGCDDDLADDGGACAGNPGGQVLGHAESAIEAPHINGGMGRTDGEDKFFANGDSGELGIGGIRGRGERALRRSGGVVDFDLRLRGFAEIEQAIGAYGEGGGIVDSRVFCRATPRADQTKAWAELTNAVGMLGGDKDRAVGVDGDVQRFANRGRRTGAQFAVAHAVGKENGDGAASAVGDVDGGSGVDGDVGRAQVGAIVLEGKARLAARRKFVDEAGGSIGDVDDGLAVAGHSHGVVELAGTVTVGAPGVDVLERRR